MGTPSRQGDNDEALGWEMNNGLLDLVENIHVVRIPNGSHWCVWTQPEAFHAALDAFLAAPSSSK